MALNIFKSNDNKFVKVNNSKANKMVQNIFKFKKLKNKNLKIWYKYWV